MTRSLAQFASMTCGLLAIVSAVGGNAVGAELRFRREASPAGNLVRLGDVAEIVAGARPEDAQLADTELFPTPAAGDKRIVQVREIRDRLALRGVQLAKHSISGASQVTIYGAVVVSQRPAPTKTSLSEGQRDQATARVRSALIEYLATTASATRVWETTFELDEHQARAVLESAAQFGIEGGSEPWTGQQEFELVVTKRNETQRSKLNVVVEAPRPVVVVARALARGTTLGPADLRLQSPTSTTATNGAFDRIEDCIGQQTVRAVSEGEALASDDLRAPLLVRRREAVTVFARSPGIQVRTTARALEDGARGDVISVESLLDRRTFFATVSGIQEVEVYARAVNAAAPAVNADEAPAPRVSQVSQGR